MAKEPIINAQDMPPAVPPPGPGAGPDTLLNGEEVAYHV
jgi:hypothetical protein